MGHLRFNVNVLTAEEYRRMMDDMGMGGMVDAKAFDGKTHRIAVYVTQHGGEVDLGDVQLSLRLSSDDGTAIVPLAYNKMMKVYGAAVALPETREHRIGVLISTPSASIGM